MKIVQRARFRLGICLNFLKIYGDRVKNTHERGGTKMKKQTITRPLIFSLLVIFLLAVFAQDSFSQSQKSFLWQVQSKTNTVYVLGSIHYLKKEMYPLDEEIEKAFEQADVLAVEADVTNVEKVDVQKLFGGAFYTENETL